MVQIYLLLRHSLDKGTVYFITTNNLQSIAASIIKLCGILVVTEAANFLLVKVEDPYISA